MTGSAAPDSVIEQQDAQSPIQFQEDTITRTGPDLADPKLRKEDYGPDGEPLYQKSYFAGPLIKDGMDYRDIQQGTLGDCYLAAAMSALALNAPEKLKNLVKQNNDGTYTFKLFEEFPFSNDPGPERITVDGDLYVKASGTPRYGRSTGDKTQSGMELWFPLAEKAYAALRGGGDYDQIEGGSAGSVFQAVLGKRGSYIDMDSRTANGVWSQLTTAVDNDWPICVGTRDDEDLYTDTGVHPDHMYTVTGYEEENGERYVKLRNPWGVSEPANNGEDDGEFRLTLSELRKLFSSLEFVKS